MKRVEGEWRSAVHKCREERGRVYGVERGRVQSGKKAQCRLE